MNKISASILNVNKEDAVHEFYNLETYKVDFFHIDVMDGKFVENNTYELMKEYETTLSHITNIGLDVHLMCENVFEAVDDFLMEGVDRITCHVEALEKYSFDEFKTLVEDLRLENVKLGIAIKPGTDIEVIKKYMPYAHMILVMTVEPGKGGQKLIPETLEKLKALKEYSDKEELDIEFEVDGGINEENAKSVIKNGASILVIGTALLNSKNPKKMVEDIKSIV